MRILITSLFLGCAATAQAATITNGDFSSGLDDFELRACAFTCSESPADTGKFFGIGLNGSNPYISVSSGSTADGFIFAAAKQMIDISETAHILTFNAVQFPTEIDPGSSGFSPFPDGLSIVLRDATRSGSFVFEFTKDGPEVDPFYSPLLSVKKTAASDPFFDLGVWADLSAFKGQTLALEISMFNENDGLTFSGGFDNFVLSAPAIPPVPLPAGLPLLLASLGALGLMKRRSLT